MKAKNNDSSIILTLEDGSDIYIIASALFEKISSKISLLEYLLGKYKPNEYIETSILQIKELIEVLDCLISPLNFPDGIDINKLKAEFELILAKGDEGND